jgi:hypothetical protein
MVFSNISPYLRIKNKLNEIFVLEILRNHNNFLGPRFLKSCLIHTRKESAGMYYCMNCHVYFPFDYEVDILRMDTQIELVKPNTLNWHSPAPVQCFYMQCNTLNISFTMEPGFEEELNDDQDDDDGHYHDYTDDCFWDNYYRDDNNFRDENDYWYLDVYASQRKVNNGINKARRARRAYKCANT